MAQKVQFVETVLRDANQSLIATRLPYDKFAPMLETIDKTGYYAVECWCRHRTIRFGQPALHLREALQCTISVMSSQSGIRT